MHADGSVLGVVMDAHHAHDVAMVDASAPAASLEAASPPAAAVATAPAGGAAAIAGDAQMKDVAATAADDAAAAEAVAAAADAEAAEQAAAVPPNPYKPNELKHWCARAAASRSTPRTVALPHVGGELLTPRAADPITSGSGRTSRRAG